VETEAEQRMGLVDSMVFNFRVGSQKRLELPKDDVTVFLMTRAKHLK
jgi:hypothetical protein